MNDDILKEILSAYDDMDYPEGFSLKYDIMECLSDQNGICTFLVQDHEGGRYVAKCFEKQMRESAIGNEILAEMSHKGLPKNIATFVVAF